jgi:hypothetical protein
MEFPEIRELLSHDPSQIATEQRGFLQRIDSDFGPFVAWRIHDARPFCVGRSRRRARAPGRESPDPAGGQ